ncbi:2TM domain-containing protein [Kribbella sp.]|uniref:2TM domain-containing protein n=1 Tax=Kribbella sp. TaxID=1871183 RepID=UPI002D6FE1E2|nr:2TM domain-containing protein [Kribbella sp.]HZX06911.1 2TM domain-containing protein [Kribbella sp.]
MLLVAGLVTRYLLRLRRTGMVLLAAVPLVDVVLLVASIVDIQRGAAPSFKHSLAAIFVGVSIGFGHQTLKWADKWAAHFMAGAPRPAKLPKKGPERARHERAAWLRHLISYLIGVGIMLGLGLLSGRGYDALLGPAVPWTIALVIDAIVSFSYSFDRTPQEKQSA